MSRPIGFFTIAPGGLLVALTTPLAWLVTYWASSLKGLSPHDCLLLASAAAAFGAACAFAIDAHVRFSRTSAVNAANAELELAKKMLRQDRTRALRLAAWAMDQYESVGAYGVPKLLKFRSVRLTCDEWLIDTVVPHISARFDANCDLECWLGILTKLRDAHQRAKRRLWPFGHPRPDAVVREFEDKGALPPHEHRAIGSDVQATADVSGNRSRTTTRSSS